jgi:hypothetical protein
MKVIRIRLASYRRTLLFPAMPVDPLDFVARLLAHGNVPTKKDNNATRMDFSV